MDLNGDIKTKIQSFCVYQERCQKEVRAKLANLRVPKMEAEEILADLIADNFVNEQRFASAYARGKFRIKKWGKKKIEMQLKQKEISPVCIKNALQEIAEEDYQKTLSQVIEKRWNLASGKTYQRKILVAKYCISRGYESHLVWGLLNSDG